MAQPNPFEEESRPIYQPLCPTCGHRMWFMTVSKLDIAHDIRTFKCLACERAETRIVTIDAD
jgi:uncharacterized protein YlaI